MAQLSDDCFAFGGPLMSVDAAVALIAERVTPVAGTDTVPIAEADGRVLAADMTAPVDLPPFDNSAVDGWAVRHADLAGDGETILPVTGRIPAGAAFAGGLDPRAAIRIFTGAIMPAGADTVFMQEDVRLLDDGRVGLPPGLKPGANRRLAGEDARLGAMVLPAGRRLRPQDIALAAAVGIATLDVRRPIRAAVFSTGDELTDPGAALGPAAIYDSNRFMLAAMLRRLGAVVSDLGILRDDRATIAAALRAASREHDLIVTSGGVSTGEEDHVKAAIGGDGRLVFWRLAIKPGRPVAMGVIDGTPLVGLPGNPVAVFVTFAHVVRPLVARLSGATVKPVLATPVRATFAYKKKAGRREYVRVSVRPGADGALEAAKHPREGAGVITSLTETDGLAELADDATRIEPGMPVGFLPYALLA